MHIFCLVVFSYFAVSALQVWRAADIFDQKQSKTYFKVRGVSIFVQGIVRVLTLWFAAAAYAALVPTVREPSLKAGVVISVVVAAVVGLELAAKLPLAAASGLPADQAALATDSILPVFRLFFYPAFMGTLGYMVIRFRATWVAVLLTLSIALTNGLGVVTLITFLSGFGINQGKFERPPEKVVKDTDRLLNFDGSDIQVDASKEDVNAFADPYGRVTLWKGLLNKIPHRGVMGIVGHEVGHIRLSHLSKRTGVMVLLSAASIAAAVVALRYGTPAARLLGLPTGSRVSKTVAGFIMFMTVEPMMRLLVSALASGQSVKHEYEADAYSAKALGPGPLSGGLKKIGELYGMTNREPLAISFPSHPPTSSRLRALERYEDKYPNRL